MPRLLGPVCSRLDALFLCGNRPPSVCVLRWRALSVLFLWKIRALAVAALQPLAGTKEDSHNHWARGVSPHLTPLHLVQPTPQHAEASGARTATGRSGPDQQGRATDDARRRRHPRAGRPSLPDPLQPSPGRRAAPPRSARPLIMCVPTGWCVLRACAVDDACCLGRVRSGDSTQPPCLGLASQGNLNPVHPYVQGAAAPPASPGPRVQVLGARRARH